MEQQNQGLHLYRDLHSWIFNFFAAKNVLNKRANEWRNNLNDVPFETSWCQCGYYSFNGQGKLWVYARSCRKVQEQSIEKPDHMWRFLDFNGFELSIADFICDF